MYFIVRFLCLVGLVAPAWALELGEFVRSSYFGEPLRAQVALMDAAPDELTGLSVELADEETYRARGMQRPWLGTPLRMEMVHELGRPMLMVETDAAPELAHADLILDVRWGGGRMFKHYGLTLGTGWKAAEILPLPPLALMVPSPWPVASSRPEPLVKKPMSQVAAVVLTPQPVPVPVPVVEVKSEVLAAQTDAVVPVAEPRPEPKIEPQAVAKSEPQPMAPPAPAEIVLMQAPKQAPQSPPVATHTGRVTRVKVEKAPARKLRPVLRLSQAAAPTPVAVPVTSLMSVPKAAPKPEALPGSAIEGLEESSVALARQIEEANARVRQLEATVGDMRHLLALQSRQPQPQSQPQPVPKLRSAERLLGQSGGQWLLAAIILAVVVTTTWLLFRSGQRVRRLADKLPAKSPVKPLTGNPPAPRRPAVNLKAANDAKSAYGTASRAPLDLTDFSLDLKTDPALAERPQRLPSGLMV